MRLIGFARLLLLVAPLVVFAVAVSPASAGTPDQQQTDASGCASYVGISSKAQTFTAGVTGNLDQVDVFVEMAPAGGALALLTVQIQTVTDGVPSGTVLATETVLADRLPFPGAWFSVPIDPVVAVTEGTQYAIVLSQPSERPHTWLGSMALNPYPGGHRASKPGPPLGAGWEASPAECDQAFVTYVAAPSTAVTFRSLSATRTGPGVLLRWRTASEIDTLGFHVYRQVNGKRVRVNTKLLAAKRRGGYSFLDRKAPKGQSVGYWVQVVSLDGSRSWKGPARVGRGR